MGRRISEVITTDGLDDFVTISDCRDVYRDVCDLWCCIGETGLIARLP
jgi:hypothetical protein